MRTTLRRHLGAGLATYLFIACCSTADAADLKLDFGAAAFMPPSAGEECDDETGASPRDVMPAAIAPAATVQAGASLLPRPRLLASTRLSSASAGGGIDKHGIAKAEMPVVTVVAQADPPKPLPVWEIVPADKTLNAALARWAATAGWQLVWELPVDYAVETRASVTGTFEEAVTQVTRSMDSAEIPLKAIFYQGNKVLRIVGKGVE